MQTHPLKSRLQISPLIILGLFCGCSNGGSDGSAQSPSTRNIILFIGDGMGAEHRKAAQWVKAGQEGMLSMDEMPASGWLETHSASSAITDSAAAATAYAIGEKTHNGVVGLDANLESHPTLLELAARQGKRVGLVSTSFITDATPAAFAAHIESRQSLNEIAAQYVASGVNVFLGGGENAFIPVTEFGAYPSPGGRQDGRNLIDEMVAAGYRHVSDNPSLGSVDGASTSRLLGLFADSGMPRPFSPSLAAMTQKAIEVLSRSPNGFFLMVEGGQIDWASHGNDADQAIADTLSLDAAVEVAKQYALQAGNTLIIVTADHETGGMTVSLASSGSPEEDGPFDTFDGRTFFVNWSTQSHTSANVPVTAQGPLSDWLNRVNDNTFVYDVMHSALGY